eukprot:TRINITY_DN3221_c0_g1_i1.p1 TRINITY_DN3221_c0_g1~~TRINITY_DN3221_c0_g1_i1.p1  ORF type:complete len:125 (+),score=21.56 TRINITY_DN3221_c0_g1_i1:70-444(+)
MVHIKIHAFPAIPATFIFIMWIFMIIAAASDNKGWATAIGTTFGWKGYSSSLQSGGPVAYSESDTLNAWRKGGISAIIGSVVGIVFTFFAFFPAAFCVLGGFGLRDLIYRICCIVSACICVATW